MTLQRDPLAMKRLLDAIAVVRQFGAKAGCMHTQRRAHQLWKEIRPHLTSDEVVSIRVAWNHHLIGEGRKELDAMIEVVVRRFRVGSEAA